MASDHSADLSSPSVSSPYDLSRIRILKSESPPGLDLQTDASSAHDFILQLRSKKCKSQSVFKYNPLIDKLSPPHHLAFCTIVRPCFFLSKYDTIAHFFQKVLFDCVNPRFPAFFSGKSMRGWEKIADSRFSDRWIFPVHVKISRAKIISVFPSKSVYRGGIGKISIRQHNKLG